jgi:hypothetical protein
MELITKHAYFRTRVRCHHQSHHPKHISSCQWSFISFLTPFEYISSSHLTPPTYNEFSNNDDDVVVEHSKVLSKSRHDYSQSKQAAHKASLRVDKKKLGGGKNNFERFSRVDNSSANIEYFGCVMRETSKRDFQGDYFFLFLILKRESENCKKSPLLTLFYDLLRHQVMKSHEIMIMCYLLGTHGSLRYFMLNSHSVCLFLSLTRSFCVLPCIADFLIRNKEFSFAVNYQCNLGFIRH